MTRKLHSYRELPRCGRERGRGPARRSRRKRLAAATLLGVIGLSVGSFEPGTAVAHEARSACSSDALEARIAAAVRHSTRLAEEPRPDASALAAVFVAVACETSIDPALLLAIAERESRFDPEARGPSGSLGLLQIKPTTARAIARERGWAWNGDASLFEPGTNLRLGAAYLAKMQQRFDSWEGALAAYNMGPARLRKRIEEGARASSGYARAVLQRRDELTQRLAAEP